MGHGDERFRLVAYGQNAEDVVLVRAFADRRAGFFVDVGAGDPVRGSLTKNLVDRLGWRGVNVEPLPERFERLRRQRPEDVNLRVAVDTEPGTATFYRILPEGSPEDMLGLSTLESAIAAEHVRGGADVAELEVTVVTLESILVAYASPGFDLLKVDVEGREAAVLASADLGFWRPRVVVAEATVPGSPEPSHQDWEPELLAAGYALALFDGLNRFYARDDEPELLARLSVPANVWDRWIPWACAQRAGLNI
ncbi:FkbM family methyltransferase [Streptosporangium sp. NBC_01810]|uniref:FkbM family methyltransferase n=1 Tax=Streptosporangium sp. NBC_01810 TaxID=2975951 RepID=UPI002DD87CEA|nr:FkbM family methyltransferase [Streptosporangium sp. NBC_01810]WSA25891.1 FkbM family methyltransferase [Streptosporangium sp. NBC_01810]